MRVEPYEHDCKNCVWVGWYSHAGGKLGNMYVCSYQDKHTVIIRYSSRPSDYWSMTAGECAKGAIEDGK